MLKGHNQITKEGLAKEAERNFLQAFGMALSKMDADNKVDNKKA
ncbi:hypothetical protein [Helicobacter pylori]|nr:hypothetical protein [Helicobacter pylori]